MIAEPTTPEREEARGHLLSVFGGDQAIGAVAAAVSVGAYFRVQGRFLEPFTVTLGKEAQCFRGSTSVPGRNRPVRHLIAMSIELSETRPGGNPQARQTVLCDDDPVFVLHRLGSRFGLPVLPEWSGWFWGELERRRSIQPLVGFGCSPVLVAGTKKRFLGWIGHALKRGLIEIPDQTGGISWPHSETFLERRIEEEDGRT